MIMFEKKRKIERMIQAGLKLMKCSERMTN